MWLKREEYNYLKLTQKNYEEMEKQVRAAKRTNRAVIDEEAARRKVLRAQQEKVVSQNAELAELLKEAQELKNKIPLKYTTLQPPDVDEQGNYDFAYYENITQILNNKFFQWYVYQFREEIISQVAYNMGLEVKFFLANNEEIAGGIKVIDHFIQGMERVRLDHNTIIEAENAKTEGDN